MRAMIVSPEQIVAIMGRPLAAAFSLRTGRAGREGLSMSARREGGGHAARGAEDCRALTAPLCRRRRSSAGATGSARMSRRRLSGSRVVATAVMWDDEADSREFLSTAHPLLEGRMAMGGCVTELGERHVEELL